MSVAGKRSTATNMNIERTKRLVRKASQIKYTYKKKNTASLGKRKCKKKEKNE